MVNSLFVFLGLSYGTLERMLSFRNLNLLCFRSGFSLLDSFLAFLVFDLLFVSGVFSTIIIK